MIAGTIVVIGAARLADPACPVDVLAREAGERRHDA